MIGDHEDIEHDADNISEESESDRRESPGDEFYTIRVTLFCYVGQETDGEPEESDGRKSKVAESDAEKEEK